MQVDKSQNIGYTTVFEDGYWWVVFEGIAHWKELETTEFIDGVPILVKNV